MGITKAAGCGGGGHRRSCVALEGGKRIVAAQEAVLGTPRAEALRFCREQSKEPPKTFVRGFRDTSGRLFWVD